MPVRLHILPLERQKALHPEEVGNDYALGSFCMMLEAVKGKTTRRAIAKWLGAGLMLAGTCLAGRASNVTLGWDPSTDPMVAGYNIYSGTASRNYTNLVNVGTTTSVTVSNLVPGTTYYFAATTYTQAGLESAYSAETAYTVPVTNNAPVISPPTLNPISDLTIPENAGPQTVALSGISTGSSNVVQVLSVSALSSNPALVPNPAVSYTSPNTTGTLTFSPAPNSYGVAAITVLVDDGAVSNNSVIRSFNVTVSQPPASPSPMTNVLIFPATAFRYRLGAPYSNGDRFSYSLGAGAPAGAKISKAGSAAYFTWTPTTAQALTTNLIQIVVTDLTQSTLSTNETILITVSDYLALTLGSSSVPAGQGATLPLSLASSSGVTNLSFTVDWPASGLTSPSLVIASPGITASSVQNQATNLLISLQTAPGQPLQGSNVVAQLKFQTLAAQPSAFITLALRNLSASKPDASAYLTYLPTAGQVAIVSSKPLLAPASTSSTVRSLTAFGAVGASYQLQYSTNLLSAGPWYPLMTYSQTNIEQTLNVDPAIPLIFYRLQAQ